MLCRVAIALGDGAKDLAAAVGEWQIEITLGSQVLQPSPIIIERSVDTRQMLMTSAFLVPANTQVTVKLLSDDASDTDVDVTAYLYDAGDTERHLCKAMLVNKKEKTIASGVLVVRDDNGSTAIKTLTPAEAAGVVTVTPS